MGNEDPASEPLLTSEATPENMQNGGPDAHKLLYFTSEKKNKSNGAMYPVPLLNRDTFNAPVANLIVLSNGDTTANIYTSPVIKLNERDNTKPHQSVATPIISALENRTSTVTLTKTVIPVVPKLSVIDLEAKVGKNIKGNNPLTIVIKAAAVDMSKMSVSDKTKSDVLITSGNNVSNAQVISILNKNDASKTLDVLVNNAKTAISKHNTTNSATLQETSIIVVNNVASEAIAVNKLQGASGVTHNASKISSTITAPHTSKLQDTVTNNASKYPVLIKSQKIGGVTPNKDVPKASNNIISPAINKSVEASSMPTAKITASDIVKPLSVVKTQSGIALLCEGIKSSASVVSPVINKSVAITAIDASKSLAAKNTTPKIISGSTNKPPVTSTFSEDSKQSENAVGALTTPAKITATTPNKPQKITEITSSKSVISGNSIPLAKATAKEKPEVRSKITLPNEGSKASSVPPTNKSLVTSSATSETSKTLGSVFSKQDIKDGINSDTSKPLQDSPANPTGSKNKNINYNPVTPKVISDALNIAAATNKPQVTCNFNKTNISSTSNVTSKYPGTEITTVPPANKGAVKKYSQSQCTKEAVCKEFNQGNKDSESIEMTNMPKPSGLGKTSGSKVDCVSPQVKAKDKKDLNVSKSVKSKPNNDNNLVNESPSRIAQKLKSTESSAKVKK